MNPIQIGNKLELFWDDYLINTSLTGAYLKQHEPRLEGLTLEFDMPWEGDGCGYFSHVYDNGVHRMYYTAWRMLNDDVTAHTLNLVRICCIESTDGIHWERPQLDIHTYPGYEKTNIIFDQSDGKFDNFHAFIDTNPACPPEERYKGTSRCDNSGYLWCWTSPDGYHWKKAWAMTNRGMFDSQNVAFWSEQHGQYICYIRGFHDMDPPDDWNSGIRDIRIITSPDFKTWSDPVMMDFCGADDVPLYTNCVTRYYRAPHMFVGMPTRYVERHEWNGNFQQLTGAEARQKRMKLHPRYGLTTTDCVLMTSRDGFHWKRFDEAWFTSGIERDYNWVYGNCYPAVAMFQTPSSLPGAPDELTLYVGERSWSMKPKHLMRYTSRIDGFRSYRADYAPQRLVTKPLLYEGGQLHLNFSTSARGYIYITVKCGKETIQSCEIFGDTLDRVIPFDGDLEQFKGKEITLEFTMSDADLYSMQFA